MNTNNVNNAQATHKKLQHVAGIASGMCLFSYAVLYFFTLNRPVALFFIIMFVLGFFLFIFAGGYGDHRGHHDFATMIRKVESVIIVICLIFMYVIGCHLISTQKICRQEDYLDIISDKCLSQNQSVVEPLAIDSVKGICGLWILILTSLVLSTLIASRVSGEQIVSQI
jgi:hypothetical protein